MTTSSEDVLLQVSDVRYKKGDGTLYVMNERLAWMPVNRDIVTVSHKFQDIKMQKISPEGKPKIQLQVVLLNGTSSTFHFVDWRGPDAQIAARDKVKELLQKLLPNFKRKVDKELEEKNKILSENPFLLQLYKDLVITQILTSEEFWAIHGTSNDANKNENKQEIGVSGAFLAEIKPQTDGCNGLKYNLTADIIDCIFKTYPAVKIKHAENVPSKLSESEFWTKFFQSHYFHRDRITSGTKDIFTECGKIDEQVLREEVMQCSGDPLLDIRQFDDIILDDGFVNAQNDKHIVNSGNIVHQNMIRRFNQHSANVLKTSTTSQKMSLKNSDTVSNSSSSKTIDEKSKGRHNFNAFEDLPLEEYSEDGTDSDSYIEQTTNGKRRNGQREISELGVFNNVIAINSKEDLDISDSKRGRIMKKICYEDLGNPQDNCYETFSNSMQSNYTKLNFSRAERFLHGPVPLANTENLEESEELNIVQLDILKETESWNLRTPHKVLVSATGAVNALGELSPGGALMRGFNEQSLAQLVPEDLEKEFRSLYLSLSELLRLFWRAFPVTTLERESRVNRMHEALVRFRQTKINQFEAKLIRYHSSLNSELMQHIKLLIHTAIRKFDKWQMQVKRQR